MFGFITFIVLQNTFATLWSFSHILISETSAIQAPEVVENLSDSGSDGDGESLGRASVAANNSSLAVKVERRGTHEVGSGANGLLERDGFG